MEREFQAGRKESELQIISLDRLMEIIRARLDGGFDMVIGIERGGILPAYLASRWLDAPLETMPAREYPAGSGKARSEPSLTSDIRGRRVLLVDDVAKTGATLRHAARGLEAAEITTMVISGEADISLFGPHERCIHWPWDK